MTDLNEMWKELEKYQPYADNRGFGEVWRRMTTKRTEAAALRAVRAARDAKAAVAEAAAVQAADAARDVAEPWAGSLAKYAVEYIHEAIEKEVLQ